MFYAWMRPSLYGESAMVPEGIDFAQTNQRTQRWGTSHGGEAVCVYINVFNVVDLVEKTKLWIWTSYYELYKLYMKFSF